jgi:DNA-binding PadR family transcriptional regulator
MSMFRREKSLSSTPLQQRTLWLANSAGCGEASGGKRQMGVGTLYPVLHSLEKKGLIESRWGDEGREERGGARRRYYKLTGSGVATLEAIQSFRSNLLSWQAT